MKKETKRSGKRPTFWYVFASRGKNKGMIIVLIRFLIVYALMIFSMKLLGKRQIGQMQQSEFVTTLFFSELLIFAVTDEEIPLIYGILPFVVMVCLEVIISYCNIRVPSLKRLLDSRPVFLIHDGKIDQQALLENRITIDELHSMLRLSSVCDITNVTEAVLEPNGQLSVVSGDQGPISLSVVQDGQINEKALELLGKNEAWLHQQLKEKGQKVEKLFLACATKDGVNLTVKKEMVR